MTFFGKTFGKFTINWNKDPADCNILGSCILENFIFAETIWESFKCQIFLLVDNNLWGKLVSSLESPTTFNWRIKDTLV